MTNVNQDNQANDELSAGLDEGKDFSDAADLGARTESQTDVDAELLFGLTPKQRYRIYGWGALLIVVAAGIWTWFYLRPDRWYKYTDQIAFEQVAKDVKLGFVLWDESSRVGQGLDDVMVSEPAISSDGARMVYTTSDVDGDANLFTRRWDGQNWGEPTPMRALNSAFHEVSPSFNGDASLLFFSTDRPGGAGGYDIWVAKWDGAEYAWPLPLTPRVNTPFDEKDPSISPDGLVLYFSSNRPRPADVRDVAAAKPEAEKQASEDQGNEVGADASSGSSSSGSSASESGSTDQPKENFTPGPDALTPEQIEKLKGVYDIYAADVASETPYDLIVERQLSMLYSLRQGALADIKVMEKLGGTAETEAAVDKALAYLASTQEPDGRWDLKKNGGANGHDVAATAFALLAFYGRGERHDLPCKYQDNVARGIKWLTDQQNGATGDLRGKGPQGNAMYDHGIASLAVVEAYGVTKDTALRPKAIAAVEFISESQYDDGGWRYLPRNFNRDNAKNEKGDLSVTGWMVMALASAQMSGVKVPDETMEGVTKYLKYVSGGKHGGSYGYTDPPKGNSNKNAMNAVGFFCAQITGHSANSTKAFESSAILHGAGFQLQDIYYVYYGTLANYQHQGPVWRKWKEAMQPQFIKAQAQDGSWTLKGAHTGSMGPVIGTALVALCLEAHYRYTPLYGLGFEPDPAGPSPDVIEHHLLTPTPLFRHAKFVKLLSSPADDTSPVVTDHGDFIYFASSREGGEGGVDLYRARIGNSGMSEPKNMGPEINTEADEMSPAVRMAGFHLMFNSTRDDGTASLYGAKSRRVVRRYDYSKMPSSAWFTDNMGLVIGFVLAFIGFIWMTRRALVQGKAHRIAQRAYAQSQENRISASHASSTNVPGSSSDSIESSNAEKTASDPSA